MPSLYALANPRVAPARDVVTSSLQASVKTIAPMSGPKCGNYEVLTNYGLQRQQLAAGKERSTELLRQFHIVADGLRAHGITAPIPPTDVSGDSLDRQTRYLAELASVLETAQGILRRRQAEIRAECFVRALVHLEGSVADSGKLMTSYDELDPDTDVRTSVSERVQSVRSHLSYLVGRPDATEQLTLDEAIASIIRASSDGEAALHEARVLSVVARCNARAEQLERLRSKATAILARYRGIDTATSHHHLKYAERAEADPASINAAELVDCESALAEELININREYVQRQVLDALHVSGFYPDSRIDTYTPLDGKLILRHEELGKYALLIEVEKNAIRGRAVELSDSSGTAAPNAVIERHVCTILHSLSPTLASQGIHANFREDMSAQRGILRVKTRAKSIIQSPQTRIKKL